MNFLLTIYWALFFIYLAWVPWLVFRFILVQDTMLAKHHAYLTALIACATFISCFLAVVMSNLPEWLYKPVYPGPNQRFCYNITDIFKDIYSFLQIILFSVYPAFMMTLFGVIFYFGMLHTINNLGLVETINGMIHMGNMEFFFQGIPLVIGAMLGYFLRFRNITNVLTQVKQNFGSENEN